MAEALKPSSYWATLQRIPVSFAPKRFTIITAARVDAYGSMAKRPAHDVSQLPVDARSNI